MNGITTHTACIQIIIQSKVKNFLREKKWKTDFLANFLGVVLGIILTFGVSGYLKYREKKAMERTAALMTISNIEFSVQTLEDISETLQSHNQVFNTIRKHYPDKLDQISEDTLYMYASCFIDFHGIVLDSSAEGIFTHSSDIWRTLDKPSLQQRIGHCFAYRNFLNNFVNCLYQKQEHAAAKFFEEKYFFDRKSISVAVKELTDIPSVRDLLYHYPGFIHFLNSQLLILKRMNERNKQDMNISDEEISRYTAFYDEDYEENPGNDSEADSGETAAE